MVEFTHSYDVFLSNNFTIDIASPKGGLGPADPQGFQFYAQDPVTQKYVSGENIPATENTISLETITDISGYSAVFFVGGTGAMWDYFASPDVPRIVRAMWDAGKIVSAVCHGPMALTNVYLANGRPLVEGRALTGFSNAEEQDLGRGNVCAFCFLGYEPGCNPATCDGPYMPVEYYVRRNASVLPDIGNRASYLLETRLRELGANYTATPQDWHTFRFRPHVVIDGRLVTGQNPGAGRETAQAVVELLRFRAGCAASGGDVAPDARTETKCTAVQFAPTDPPVVCNTTGGLRCAAGCPAPPRETCCTRLVKNPAAALVAHLGGVKALSSVTIWNDGSAGAGWPAPWPAGPPPGLAVSIGSDDSTTGCSLAPAPPPPGDGSSSGAGAAAAGYGYAKWSLVCGAAGPTVRVSLPSPPAGMPAPAGPVAVKICVTDWDGGAPPPDGALWVQTGPAAP